MLATAIYHYELPDEAGFLDGSRIYLLTLSLHVAVALAEICVAEEGARWAMLPNLFTKAARLGIDTEELNSMAEGITASWLEWGNLLKIQTCEVTSFADLLASSQPREQVPTSPVCTWPNNKSALLICTESQELFEIAGYLEANSYAVQQLSNSRDGLAAALENIPDLIIIEMSASGIDGAAFCHSLRGNPVGQRSYTILIVNHEDAGILKQVLDMGADDFLLRPITAPTLHAKLRGAFTILQLQKELIKERNGLVNSAREWAGTNRRLIHVAMTDPLTQLSNRRHGMDFFFTEWVFAKANNLPLACLMIDIDYFKHINDQHGHKAGDSVLVNLASLLQANARGEDMVFRYGGEEFCVICPGATLETACAIAERIRQNTADQRFNMGGLDIAITVSIGVAIMTPAQADEEALMHDADAAMYRAKKAGRNQVAVVQ